MNTAWQGTLEPQIEGKTFVLNRVHLDSEPSAGCTSDVTHFCEGKLPFSLCSFVYVNLTIHALKLDALRFTALNVPAANDRNVAAHTNPGLDASVITDGVFAPNDWNAADPAYVVVLPHNTKQAQRVADACAFRFWLPCELLGALRRRVCDGQWCNLFRIGAPAV